MKAVTGGIVHESSTIATAVTGATGLADFAVMSGPGLIAGFTGTNTVIGGYLAACHQHGVPVWPALHARAEPAGAVAADAYEELQARFLDQLDGLPAAGQEPLVVLLDLHGAGVIEPGASLELRLLRAVRARLAAAGAAGAAATVAVTLDLHGNLPQELAGLADVIVGFHEYPHTDMAERARRAAGIAFSGAHARSWIRRLPTVLPPSPTDGASGADGATELRELARAAERVPGVFACTPFHGFPYAGTSQAAASIVTVTDDPSLARRVNGHLAGWLERESERFRPHPLTASQAVAVARGRAGPAVIGDAGDNPGGGGSGDGTYLLRAVLESGLPACFATLHDPGAVRQAARAGAGARIEVRLGGRHGGYSGPALPVTATVRAITDGRVVQRTMRAGTVADFGRSARLAVGNTEVIVSSQRRQVLDPEILLLHGLVPERYDLIAVKSAHHFRSGFARVGRTFLVADSPGLTSMIPAIGKEERTGEPSPGDRQPPQHHAADLSGAR